ncbi:MAG: hypothetical protein A2845_01680 [Candidatus Lloydbacteria bacterium RIFCSPHIGHO2_01_FULL_49_22]|uniref:Uncharacterized protein n=1 Tax=Candidatus Lloydbacteria bacterium RIFCSPHIGHO2_01_FULL_49_22 TaxID=1798658 RepID=A0A1G2CXW7_9BACT|nr:MAG: hypothetical protein A2845_01680 [Candidatus Lloydbacteria bacterium RIFCSPHIGHO2_01_FULL_49_22]OGZ10008.1 MAG: hypothetical protein A3C14_04845 [Candidatus Lloydbacteria bacterium RIFCSPHIGHO2_02_FULL_50_18]
MALYMDFYPMEKWNTKKYAIIYHKFSSMPLYARRGESGKENIFLYGDRVAGAPATKQIGVVN